MTIKKWNALKFGELNFENICRLYSSDKSIRFSKEPPFVRSFYTVAGKKKFAVRWNMYKSGADFCGESFTDCDYFVLKGNCEIAINEKVIKLHTNNYLEMPKGKYKIKVTGDEPFECVAVYKMPEDFQISGFENNNHLL